VPVLLGAPADTAVATGQLGQGVQPATTAAVGTGLHRLLLWARIAAIAAMFIEAGVTGKAGLAMQAAVGAPNVCACQSWPRITATPRYILFSLLFQLPSQPNLRAQ